MQIRFSKHFHSNFIKCCLKQNVCVLTYNNSSKMVKTTKNLFMLKYFTKILVNVWFKNHKIDKHKHVRLEYLFNVEIGNEAKKPLVWYMI